METETVYLRGGPCDGETRDVALWICAIEIAQPMKPQNPLDPILMREALDMRIDLRDLIPRIERARYVRLDDASHDFEFSPPVSQLN